MSRMKRVSATGGIRVARRAGRFAIVLSLLLVALALPVHALAAEKVCPQPGTTLTDPSNDYLAILVGSDGRFNSGATGIITGSEYRISYAWPNVPSTSFTTIRVDGVDRVLGYDGALPMLGPTDVSPTMSETEWVIGDIEVTQQLSLVTGTSTGRPDTGQYTYKLRNLSSTQAHDVGARVMIDTMLANNDAAPFRVPGTGDVTTEMDFLGASIPEYWQAFEDLSNPNIMAQGTLKGGGAVTPDRFSICSWSRVWNAQYNIPSAWDYTTTPALPTGDSATVMWWNPITLQPGESRTVTTFYGLATMSGTADLSVTGPVALAVIGGAWSPNPFAVTAYVANNTGTDMANVPVHLTLPAGLALAPGETADHTIPSILAGNSGQTSFNVMAVSAGTWTYSVSAIQQTASRDVLVPLLAPVGNPEISVEKLISIDGGANWIDADAAPGAFVPFGVNPLFRYVATNEGDVALTNVAVADSVFGVIGTASSLAANGGYATFNYGPVPFATLFPCASDFLVWGKGTASTSAVRRDGVVIGASGSKVLGNVGSEGDVYVNGGGTARITGALVTASQFQQKPAQVSGPFLVNQSPWPSAYPKPTFVIPPAPPGGPNKTGMPNGYDWTTMPLANGIVTLGAQVKLHFTGAPGGAVYFFDSLSLGNGGKLYFDLTNGPVKIYVKNQVSFGSGTTSILTGGDASMISLESLYSGTTSKPYGFNHAGGYWAGDVVCQTSGIHFGNGSTSGIFEGHMWSDWSGKYGTAYSNAIYIEHGATVKLPPTFCQHQNTATASGTYEQQTVTESENLFANWHN